ncbi:MAG: pyridoxal phosphate-dependent aminotransferase [Deltaproteobacteria bacterium]|nr:pyridoxal phosphate-dependent aminotransferase [Deltaproteobacteria bacterium]
MPRFPDFASTAGSLSDSVYSRLAARARELDRPIYPLQVGDTWMEPHPAIRAEAQRTEDEAMLHTYAPVQGTPMLCKAILAKLERQGGRPLDPADLQVMSGATVGLSVICQTLLDPGDEVLLPAPYWPLIRGIIASRGGVPVEIPFWDRLGEEGFDAEAAIRAAITERTVALYLNSPNNPTGRLLPEPIAAALARVAAEHDLWIWSDEAYEDLIYVDDPPPPLWTREDFRERCITSHTFSKSYGIAGARVGYTHGPHEVMKAIRGVQTFQSYNAPKPMQRAAARALGEAGEWLAEARAAYARAGRLCAEALGLPPPEGSTFFFFDVAPFFREGEDLLAFLGRVLEETGVLLTPGSASGKDYPTHVRMCFTSVPPEKLEEALGLLAPLLRAP